jgi:ankyrin repeat protein
VQDGNTLLMVAANRGHSEIVSFLLQHPQIDVDVRNPEGFCALSFASRSSHLTVVASLVGQGADIGVLSEVAASRCCSA